MDELVIETPEYPTMILNINGRDITIRVYLSLFSIIYIQKNSQKEADSRILVEKALDNLLSENGIDTHPERYTEAQLIEFANKTLVTNEILNNLFENQPLTNPFFDRYIHAIIGLEVADPFLLVRKQIKEVVESIQESYLSVIKPSLEIATTVQKQLAEAVKPIASYAESLSKNLSVLSDAIRNAVQRINVTSITKERKQELLDSYTQWGKWGWTGHDDFPFNAMFQCPASKREADKYFSKLVTGEIIDAVIEELRNDSRIRTSDVNEAVACFEEKQYKACALLLFSLIDSLLIKCMSREEYKNKRRPSGKKATNKLKERVQIETQKDNILSTDSWSELLTLLSLVSMFSALETFFADGKDFIAQPEITNKNFLSHGMQYKPVLKRECIQLFLLLNNLSTAIEEGIFDA